VFRIAGGSAAARRWLRQRYAPFVTHGPAHFTLRVGAGGRRTAGRPPRPRVDWERGKFMIALPSCRAEGDLRRGTARLTAPRGAVAVSPGLLRAICSLRLLAEGGLLFHASAVVSDRGAWVFCGPSESGKTTLARLAAPRWVLNDETVAVIPRGAGYAAAATPFFGEGGPVMAGRNGLAPLRALFFIHHGAGFVHRRLRPVEAVARAWPQIFAPKRDPAVGGALLAAVAGVAQKTPCFDFAFTPTLEVWDYVDAIA